MRTFSPVFSSSSVWNFSMGWDWFSASHKAFRLRFVKAKGKFWSLQEKEGWLNILVTMTLPLSSSLHQIRTEGLQVHHFCMHRSSDSCCTWLCHNHTAASTAGLHCKQLFAHRCPRTLQTPAAFHPPADLFPATSRTCSSVVLASSAGSRARRLSRRDRTFRLAQPPISAGRDVKRFRSTFRFVSLVSFPRDLGKA